MRKHLMWAGAILALMAVSTSAPAADVGASAVEQYAAFDAPIAVLPDLSIASELTVVAMTSGWDSLPALTLAADAELAESQQTGPPSDLIDRHYSFVSTIGAVAASESASRSPHCEA